MFHGRLLSRTLYLVAAGLVLANTGCLAVALGTVAAGGTAAAAYAYANGKYYRDYPTKLPDTQEATHTALKELGFPIDHEEPGANKDYIESKTGDGEQIKVYVESIPSRVPAEGGVIRVGVRVGAFGDQAVSARILDQISLHLVAPVQTRPDGPAPPPPPPKRLQPLPYETPPPPLASQPK
jgi:hypothetical protein